MDFGNDTMRIVILVN